MGKPIDKDYLKNQMINFLETILINTFLVITDDEVDDVIDAIEV